MPLPYGLIPEHGYRSTFAAAHFPCAVNSRQFGASAPIIPHRVQTIRARKSRTSTASDQRSAGSLMHVAEGHRRAGRGAHRWYDGGTLT